MNKKILLFATLFAVFSGQFVEAGKKDRKKTGTNNKNRQGNNQQGLPQGHDDAILAAAAAAAAAEAAASSASASAGTGSRRAGYPSAAAALRQAGYFVGSNGGDEEAAAASAASATRKLTPERIRAMLLSDPDIHVQGGLNKKIREIVEDLGDFPIAQDLNDRLANIYQTKTTIHESIQKIEDEIVDVIRSIVWFVIKNSDRFSLLLKEQAENILLTLIKGTSVSSDNRSEVESDLSILNANIVILLQDRKFNETNVQNALRSLNRPLYEQVYNKLPELLANLDALYRELQEYAFYVFAEFEPIIEAKQQKAELATVGGQGYPSAAAAAAASAAQQAAQKESLSSASQSGGGCDEGALGKNFKQKFQRAIRKNQAKQKAESARTSSVNSSQAGYPSAAAAAAASVAQQAAQKESRSSASASSGGGCDEEAAFQRRFRKAILSSHDGLQEMRYCMEQLFLGSPGVDISGFIVKNTTDRPTALLYAAGQGKHLAVKCLLETAFFGQKKGDICKTDNFNRNVLHYAASCREGDDKDPMSTIKYLIEHATKSNCLDRLINAPDNDNQTPLRFVSKNQKDIARILEKAGATLGGSKGAKNAEDNAASASASATGGGGGGGAAAVVAQATQPTTTCEIVLKNNGSPIPLSSSEKCSFIFFVEQNELLSRPIHATIFIKNQHTKEKNYSVFDLKLDLQNQAGQRIFLLTKQPSKDHPQGLVLDITEHLLDIENKKTPSFELLRNGENSYLWNYADSIKTQGIRKTTDGGWKIIPK